jgi:hypothetical protein
MPNPTPLTLTPQAREAQARLTAALVRLAARGLRTHCSDPEFHHYWSSELEKERRLTVRWCAGCPVLEPCGDAAAAVGERWGVWGGVDRTPRQYKINKDTPGQDQ